MMRLRKRHWALGVFFLVSLTVRAGTGTLMVTITDSAGRPLPGTRVVVSSPESLTDVTEVTSDKGVVRLGGLSPSSKYRLDIAKLGYEPLGVNNIKVVSGKQFALHYALSRFQDDLERIEVVGRWHAAAIDTTSSEVGMDITLDLTESLPTGRSYQSYLQLVPGTKPTASGNPSSKSGVNFVEFGGDVGRSTDNVYLLDGINVTDNQTGSFGANINSEIIQEQRVLTGGIPAEYEGGSGLVSQVVTKSGGNEFHGSVNYYLQNDSLVERHEHLPENSFSNYDTAVTLGGPLIRDKLWFFGSYQEKSERQDVTDGVSGRFMRSVRQQSDLFFGKLTWEPTAAGALSFTYFNDPTRQTGSTNSALPNNRNLTQKSGGDNYKLEYSHSWQDWLVTLKATSHEGESSVLAMDHSIKNSVAYRGQADITNADTHKGGGGHNRVQFRKRRDLEVDLEYFVDAGRFGSHTLKGGYRQIRQENDLEETMVGGLEYKSIGLINSGTSLSQYINGGWTGDINLSFNSLGRIINAMAHSPDADQYLAAFDIDGSGAISAEELSNGLVFDSTQGNPTGDINVFRMQQTNNGPVRLKVDGQALYLQDALAIEDLTVTAGVRAEKWRHKASDGSTVATFGWDVAPRVSAVWNIDGEGTNKAWAFAGRYYDPIRTNMTYFTGNVTGPAIHHQVYVEDNWLPFFTRGGAGVRQAHFAPALRTPYTDELMLGFASHLGEDMSLEATFTRRQTRDLIEDLTLALYDRELAGTAFHLPMSHFGYQEDPGSNYIIANLEGGKRDYRGLELSFHKHRTDNWMMSASYTYGVAEGNSNSDSSVNFQGDFVWLDPRAPGAYGRLPGSIDHLFKAYGTYYFANGLEFGAVYRWNSGTRYSENSLFAGRYQPVLTDEPYHYGGITGRWISDSAVGAHRTPSYGILDIRLKYTRDFGALRGEIFLDVFNLFNHQAVTGEQSLVAGDGVYAFGQANAWARDRRLYLGTRFRF